MIPEGTDREALRERLIPLLDDANERALDVALELLMDGPEMIFGVTADAILDADEVGVYDPATHVAVDRTEYERMVDALELAINYPQYGHVYEAISKALGAWRQRGGRA